MSRSSGRASAPSSLSAARRRRELAELADGGAVRIGRTYLRKVKAMAGK